MLKKIALFTVLLAVLSCQKNTAASANENGGSVVGNGLIKYTHPTRDFSFDYDSTLNLASSDSDTVIIDNSTLAVQAKGRVSKVEFSIIPDSDSKNFDLLAFAKKTDPSLNWQLGKVAGHDAVFSRVETPSKVDAQFYFDIRDDRRLRIVMDLNSHAFGIKLLSPIVNSLAFDTEPPVIHEVFFEPATIRAGETTKLKIHATDNASKILAKNVFGSVSLRSMKSCHELLSKEWFGVEICGEMKERESDWYEFEIKTSPRLAQGEYVFYPMMFWDDSGNSRQLDPDFQKGTWIPSPGGNQKNIAMRYLTVVKNESFQMPLVSNIRFEPATIKSGDSTSLVFESSPLEPSFKFDKICARFLNKDFFKFYREDVQKNSQQPPTEYSVPVCAHPEMRADGAWVVPIQTLPFLPPGQYGQFVDIKDDASNKITSVWMDLDVTNDKVIDKRGPVVLDIKAARDEMTQSETGTILFKATDDFSGIDFLNSNNKNCFAGLTRLGSNNHDKNDKWRLALCESQIRAIGGDWYAIDFKLGKNIPTGVYGLNQFSVRDKIGNRTSLEARVQEKGLSVYGNQFSPETYDISVVTIKVIQK